MPDATADYSDHISVIGNDLVEDWDHAKLDKDVIPKLDAKRKDPQTDQDYLDLVKFIIRQAPYMWRAHHPDEYARVVKGNYLMEPNGPDSDAWRDFKRAMKLCLEAGKFRTIRRLGTVEFLPLPTGNVALSAVLAIFYTEGIDRVYYPVKLRWSM